MIRFEFRLTPLASVPAWGDPWRHWFGLTDGQYWIAAGEHEIFRYADDDHHYADYYVVRLWEDVLGLLPHLAEDVPDDLVEFLESSETELGEADLDDDEFAALAWWGNRSLDTGYLVNGPRIRIWRVGEAVTVAWANAPHGEFEFAGPRAARVRVPAGEFFDAVTDFDRRLIAAMDARIDELAAGGAADEEIAALRREHAGRATWLTQALARPTGPDWDAVRSGAAKLTGRRETSA